MKKVLVIGASENPERFAFKATHMLQKANHEVHLLGKKKGVVAGIPIETTPQPIEKIDTVTLYVNPSNQLEYIPYILSLKPKEVIFNPGTENDYFYDRLKMNSIEPIEACTLVLLSTNQF